LATPPLQNKKFALCLNIRVPPFDNTKGEKSYSEKGRKNLSKLAPYMGLPKPYCQIRISFPSFIAG
jgi:hypothetical protein